MIIIIIILLIVLGIWGYLFYKKRISLILLLKDKKACENDLINLKHDLAITTAKLSERNEQLEYAEKYSKEQEELIKNKLSAEYNKQKNELEEEYNQLFADLFLRSQEIESSIQIETDKLQALKDKQLAYLKEQQRKEEMSLKKDYYKLNLSENAIQDIKCLREAQSRISQKDVVDKIIWTGYYKPAYDVLMSHLFNKNIKVVCGIYKITCLENEKIYIGQSVDIKTRFSDHIKSAISCAAAANKLYKEMQKYGPQNFTFEVLEEIPKDKLNERELYWIDFYGTKEFGLNTTKGNS